MFWLRWLWYLCINVLRHGSNLYSVLNAHCQLHPQKIALIIDQQHIDHATLKSVTDQYILHWTQHPIANRQVALLLSQDLQGIAALFALSRLGKAVVIVNPQLIQQKLDALIQQQQLFLVGTQSVLERLQCSPSDCAIIPEADQHTASPQTFALKASWFNLISVCSSGSTGIPKIASRKSKPWQALPLLNLMFRQLPFLRLQQIFVMTPICHAAGLTATLMAFSFAKPVILQSRFDIENAKQLIQRHGIACLNLVPTLLFKLLQSNANLSTVSTIISGSAPLNPRLYQDFQQAYPHIQLYNLYGSSETGINILATPQDLQQQPQSIGKAIRGVKTKILNVQGHPVKIGETGILWTRCGWSIRPNQWMQCGDLATQDEQGYFYLKGRQDDMLICGGINVYPIDLENLLLMHPAIHFAQAYAVADEERGQCLSVNVLLHQSDLPISQADIQAWLQQHAPRYLRPKHIHFITDIATDSIGKPCRPNPE